MVLSRLLILQTWNVKSVLFQFTPGQMEQSFQLCKAILFYHFFERLFLRYFPKAIILLIATENCCIILALHFLTFLVDHAGIVVQCLLHSRLSHYCLWYQSLLIPFLL